VSAIGRVTLLRSAAVMACLFALAVAAPCGQVIPLTLSDVASLAGVIEPRVSGDLQTILKVEDSLSGRSRSFDVPVDASIDELHVLVDLDLGLTATLVRPSGAPVTAADPGATIDFLGPVTLGGRSVGRRPIYRVDSPEPGLWRVEMSGSAQSGTSYFSISAEGVSPVSFDFELVTAGLFGSHDNGMALAGAPAVGTAVVPAGPDNAVFRLVDDSGATLQKLALIDESRRSKPYLQTAPVVLPDVSFWVVMTGTDRNGALVQRQFRIPFRAQSVAVMYDGLGLPIRAGATRSYPFVVTNLGDEPATFVMSAETSLGKGHITPAELPLGARSSAIATYELTVPAGARRGSPVDLMIIATNQAVDGQYNTAKLDLQIADPDDLDGDYFPNARDMCPNFPTAQQADADGDGVGDECDPAPGTLVIRDFSPKSGLPGTKVTVYGAGFSPVPSDNRVAFAGVPGAVLEASPTELVVRVPSGAMSGPLIVLAPRGDALSPRPFHALLGPPLVRAPQ
jgi:hypothetical protein